MSIIPKIKLFCILGLIYVSSAIPQTIADDFKFVLQKRPRFSIYHLKHEGAIDSSRPNHRSEIKLLALTAIRLYQLTLSSQDIPACNFVPSCSRFSQQAVQRAGFIRGLLLSADRLQRCHGLPGIRYYYKFLPGIEKLSDPIENYLE